jgi:transforming growth factor-beta-induced protein
MFKLKYFFAFSLVSGLIFSSCKKDEEVVVLPTLNDYIAQNSDVSIFNAAIEKAGLQSYKNGGGPFTWFMPTNTALQAQGITEDSVARMTQGIASYFVTYHLINARFSTNDMIALYSFPRNTVQGNPIYTGGDLGIFYVNGIKILSANNEVAGGLVHKINSFMTPLPLVGNLQAMLNRTGQHKLFIQALTKANRWNQLSSTTAYTVLAPTNAAMTSAGLDSAIIASATVGRVDSIVRYHYFNSSRLFANDFGNRETPQTALGAGRTITSSNNGLAFKGKTNTGVANVTSANLLGTNGVLHILDGVLKF